jgi:hypothetical protein
MESLKQKFKDSSRPVVSDEAVKVAKAEFGRKRLIR